MKGSWGGVGWTRGVYVSNYLHLGYGLLLLVGVLCAANESMVLGRADSNVRITQLGIHSGDTTGNAAFPMTKFVCFKVVCLVPWYHSDIETLTLVLIS